jgi:hypothetical protein
MWAFDGSLSAWVGFTATDSEQNYGLGLDTSTGHVFIKAGDTGATGNTTSIEHIIVAAGRDTPTPQGVKFPFDVNNSQVLWMVDSPTHRVILPMENGDMAVLLDRTPVTSPRVVDYDSLTADIPEGSDTASTFAGDASGFGARALLVGGYGGLLDPINANTGGATPSTVGGFSPGDRSVTAANVPLIDLRDTGAAASAQSVAPDSLTQNDYSTEQQNVKTNGNSVKPGTGTEIARRMDWQWPAATCLDAEGKKDEQPQSGPGGNSLVTCDLANAFDSATTSYNGFDLQGVTVGSASFETTSQRDPKKGLVTTATAVARDVRILVDTGGSLFIQRVEATATTTAHGRTGTAKASWASLIEGVVLRDANGAVLFSCDQCDPRSLSDQVNSSVLSTKLRILLPNALVQTTPHGAFASVGKNDTDYWSGLTLNDDNSRAVPAMQIEVYNDYGQKSRLVVQLASIQASSIYGIHRIPQFQPGSGGGIVPPEVLPSVVHQNPGVYLNGGGNVGSLGGDLSTYRKLVRGLGLLVRSPKDAVLFALVCLLFVGSAAVARRRQLLASSLEEIVK